MTASRHGRGHRHPAAPEDYQFADRAEHEAAFAWAAQFGPQLGMPSADVFPPLPHTADILAAWASTLPDRPSRFWGRFAEIPTARNDPRVPWRDPPTGLVQHIKHVGYLLIRGVGPMSGWEGILLRTYPSGAVSEHLLVGARSGRLVRFDDRHDAIHALQPVVNAGGLPPRQWRWHPPTDIDAEWTPLPEDQSWPRAARITRRGVGCRWVIVDVADGVYVLRNRVLVYDANGPARQFADVSSAKTYCERADST